eukprot:CAMPEP_0114487638 /NCGR_PEP_ID=MMETSP0109-20121206/884_1 /TAXON_ID=29199 /ORGANISM="Chlorarachnion reptans, Strain CCCM449" /LENGTH=124 /DNA_ID=CAMNT_0001663939 /DNA_START=273 /DNA_END=647 /DNA_ORIENTATION=+
MNEERKTLTFSAVQRVKVSEKILLISKGCDFGSTYKNLSCETCNAALGRQYITTSQSLDNARAKFCFNEKAVRSYEVGRLEDATQANPKFDVLERLRFRQSQMMQIMLQFDARLKLLEAKKLDN